MSYRGYDGVWTDYDDGDCIDPDDPEAQPPSPHWTDAYTGARRAELLDRLTPRLDRFFAPADRLLMARLLRRAQNGEEPARLVLDELAKDAGFTPPSPDTEENQR